MSSYVSCCHNWGPHITTMMREVEEGIRGQWSESTLFLSNSSEAVRETEFCVSLASPWGTQTLDQILFW
jgi:hypothetical protein